jgi:membrane protein YdbS with pleckstrin-like domain
MASDKVNPAPSDRDRAILEIQYDYSGYTPIMCSWCCTALITIIGIPCLPFIPCCVSKWMKSRKTVLTERHVKHRSGFITVEDRTIPLDRVQDVKLVQGICDRCFGVQALVIETAGSSNPQAGAECTIYAPVDPMRVRDTIMAQRDAIVYGNGAGASAKVGDKASDGPGAVARTDAWTQELKDIKESVKHIEQMMAAKT